jgi:hypothetical protein
VRTATAYISFLFTLPCLAGEPPRAGVDILSTIETVRAEHPAVEPALPSLRAMRRQLLATPRSPYSELVQEPAFITGAAWKRVIGNLPLGTDAEVALSMLRFELGATRARPGADVTIKPGWRDPFIAASAIKAGVDPDIFWRVLDVVGYQRFPHAAAYVVALQMLRDKAAATPEARRRMTGVDTDVLDHFMQARHMDDISPSDLTYLSTLLQNGLRDRHATNTVSEGHRQLGTPLRVARVAAAYRDSEGYTGGYPCLPDGSPNIPHAGTGEPGDERPLCFVAATDHAVQRWYTDEARRRDAWLPPRQTHDKTGLLTLFAWLVPLFDAAAVLEAAEASVVEDLAASGTASRLENDAIADEVDLLACRTP